MTKSCHRCGKIYTYHFSLLFIKLHNKKIEVKKDEKKRS